MKLSVIKGDITQLKVDVIVNAANEGLRGGGGVDGAIHRAGGPIIMEECRQIGRCPTGEAVITNAGNLPVKKVIHTVGPIWRGGASGEEKLLSDTYRNSLALAMQNNLRTIAFPNISTGVYGYPKKQAAEVATQTVQAFAKENPNTFNEITFVCFDDENYQLYKEMLT